jgi:cell division protein ZapA (FtsZ GTPase activity inhibitor)
VEQFVKINLFGRERIFAADTDEELQAQRVADCLSEEIVKVENRTTGFANNDILILAMAALNIAANYIELKDKYDDLSKKISDKSVNVLKTLDSFIIS